MYTKCLAKGKTNNLTVLIISPARQTKSLVSIRINRTSAANMGFKDISGIALPENNIVNIIGFDSFQLGNL